METPEDTRSDGQRAYEAFQVTRFRAPGPAWDGPSVAKSRKAWEAAGHAVGDPLRAIIAEILAAYDDATRFDRTPEIEAQIAEWRKHAGLED